MNTTPVQPATGFIDESKIAATLASGHKADPQRVREILSRARELKGLDGEDVAVLANIDSRELTEELFSTARWLKNEIYGSRLVLFAPLYISNLCNNECSYCAFRVRNRDTVRRALTPDEIAREVKILVDQGHKRVLMVAGEAYPCGGIQYILDSIEAIYKVRSGRGEIRRVNVNIAPLSVGEFKQLRDAKIGTYQLFQETYHRATYATMHTSGPKRDFDWRVNAMDRAMQAGIDDVGIGALFGLYDWRFEMLAMMQHIRHLEAEFGVGPHTISVPRIEPAVGSDVAFNPPHAVSNTDFLKIVAILRLAVPYTGIIMSTRENAATRQATLALGVSQISAGSRTDPGGYGEKQHTGNTAQFQLGDHRSLDEVVRDVASLGYTPSFCTACYRMGRTGADFMHLAKPGLIKRHCDPNALSSCQEYLNDYASSETRKTGETLLDNQLTAMDPTARAISRGLLDRVQNGERDVFV